jgi:hypothetical protein
VARLATRRIIHPPHFGPCLHTIRSDDLMPPLGWENRVWRPGNARGAWGGASRLMAERPGFGGWGDRSTCLYVTAAPITRNSALGDYPLSLGIGPPKVASAQAARYQTQNMVDYRERAEECRRLAKLRAGSEHWAGGNPMSAFDPKRTSATQFCCDDCLPALFVLAQIWMVLIVRFSISSRTCA